MLRYWRVAGPLLAVAVLYAVPVAAQPARAATRRSRADDIFSLCKRVRDVYPDPASGKEATRFAKGFKRVHVKKIAQGLANAESKRDRRRATNAAYFWCNGRHQYRVVTLTVPPRIEFVDSPTAHVTGQTDPGATVQLAGVKVTADASGNFAQDVGGLARDQETQLTITASSPRHYSTSRTTTLAPVESEAAFKASAGGISYDELSKDPESLKGRRIYSRAQVFQYDARTGTSALLASVTQKQPGQFEFWTDNVLLKLADPGIGNGIDNNDIIEFWGVVAGAYSYDTAIGGSNTVPSIDVRYLHLLEKREQ